MQPFVSSRWLVANLAQVGARVAGRTVCERVVLCWRNCAIVCISAHGGEPCWWYIQSLFFFWGGLCTDAPPLRVGAGCNGRGCGFMRPCECSLLLRRSANAFARMWAELRDVWRISRRGLMGASLSSRWSPCNSPRSYGVVVHLLCHGGCVCDRAVGGCSWSACVSSRLRYSRLPAFGFTGGVEAQQNALVWSALGLMSLRYVCLRCVRCWRKDWYGRHFALCMCGRMTSAQRRICASRICCGLAH